MKTVLIYSMLLLMSVHCQTQQRKKTLQQGAAAPELADNLVEELQDSSKDFYAEMCQDPAAAESNACKVVEVLTSDEATEPLEDVLTEVLTNPDSTILEDAEILVQTPVAADTTDPAKPDNSGAIAMLAIGSVGVAVGGAVGTAGYFAEKKFEKYGNTARDLTRLVTSNQTSRNEMVEYMAKFLSGNYVNISKGVPPEFSKTMLENFYLLDATITNEEKIDPDLYKRKLQGLIAVEPNSDTLKIIMEAHFYILSGSEQTKINIDGIDFTFMRPQFNSDATMSNNHSSYKDSHEQIKRNKIEMKKLQKAQLTKVHKADNKVALDTRITAGKYSKIGGAIAAIIGTGVLIAGLGTYGYQLEGSTKEKAVDKYLAKLNSIFQELKASAPKN